MKKNTNPNHPIIFTSPDRVDVEIRAWVKHIPFAFYLTSIHRPSLFVELGVHSGNSYNAFCQAVDFLDFKTRCFGIDTWKGDEHSGAYEEQVYQDLAAYQTEKYGNFSQLLRMTFDDALSRFHPCSIDLLHIDGCHRYEDVKHDFESWLPKMSDRGIILFHDTEVRERDFGVWKLWEEVSSKYPSFNFRHSHGLGCLFVGTDKSLTKIYRLTEDFQLQSATKSFEMLGSRILAEAVLKHERQLKATLKEDLVKLTRKLRESRAEFSRIREEHTQLVDDDQKLHGHAEALREALTRERRERKEDNESLGHDLARLEQELNLNREVLDAKEEEIITRIEIEEGLKHKLESVKNDLERVEIELTESRAEQDELVRQSEENKIEFDVRSKELRELINQEKLKLTDASQTVQNLQESLLDREALIVNSRARESDLLKQVRSHWKEIQDLRNSVSFRIGWMLTRPLGWLLDGGRSISRFSTYRALALDYLKVFFSSPITAIRSLNTRNFRRLKQAIEEEEFNDIRSNMRAALSGEEKKVHKEIGLNTHEDLNLLKDKLQGDYGKTVLEQIRYFQSSSPTYFREFTRNPKLDGNKVKAIAFYLPQFHVIPENNEWWGEGFTEWTNATQGLPYYQGHYQPRLPGDLGFYDLSTKETITRQVEIARNYGLDGFCFHYYWFAGKRLLERPLDAFVESDVDFNFCLCWANENWTRRWDGMDHEILIKQDHENDDPAAFVRDLLKYLSDDRYIKIDGRHLVIVYRPGIIPNVKVVVEKWRQEFRRMDFPDPIIAMAQGFDLDDPRDLGFDLAIEFPPHKLGKFVEPINRHLEFFDDNYEGRVHSYQDIIDVAKSVPRDEFPLVRTVFPSWDNEARKKGKGTSYAFSTPRLYREWFRFACKYSIENPVFGESLVFINAWNEWGEGAYLEPDRHFGYAYLEETYNVLNEQDRFEKARIVIVSHDAHQHGAQINALNKAKIFKRQFGYDVVTLLLRGGLLSDSFNDVSECHILEKLTSNEQIALFKDLWSRGYNTAICNTTVSGLILKELSSIGFECLGLVHELPTLIMDYKLVPHVEAINEHASKIVFASSIVQDGFNSFLRDPLWDKQLIRAQGAYSIDFDNIANVPFGTLRNELEISTHSKIVGNVGFGDYRKGFDLFLTVAEAVSSKDSSIHFVWIGNLEESMRQLLISARDRMSNLGNIHILPFRSDIISCINDLDLFILTSREDPFPSVVLEALALGVPCMVFEGSGGIVDLNQSEDILIFIRKNDCEMMAEQIHRHLADEDGLNGRSKIGLKIVKESYRFDEYCFFLSTLFSGKYKKISVVVPNYNYAHYLSERLSAIWNQSYPIFEVVFLDDASADGSLVVLLELCHVHDRTVRLFTNKSNSGLVFRQWQKGVNLARGDYLWIAEADDSAKESFLERLVRFYDFDDNIGLVYAQSEQIDSLGEPLAGDYRYYTDDINPTKWLKDYVNDGLAEIKEALSIKNTILNVSSVLWDLARLQRTLHYSESAFEQFKVAGDWFLYVQVLRDYNIGFCYSSLNIHRRHEESRTLTLDSKRHVAEIAKMHEVVSEIVELDEELEDRSLKYLGDVSKQLGLC